MPEPAQNRKSIPNWLLLLCLAVAVASGIGVLWQARLVREQSSQVARQTRENQNLRGELDRLSRTQPAPTQAPVPPAAPRVAQPNAPASGTGAPAAAEQQVLRMREE